MLWNVYVEDTYSIKYSLVLQRNSCTAQDLNIWSAMLVSFNHPYFLKKKRQVFLCRSASQKIMLCNFNKVLHTFNRTNKIIVIFVLLLLLFKINSDELRARICTVLHLSFILRLNKRHFSTFGLNPADSVSGSNKS